MLFSTEALVLRCMDTSDYDRILTLLTPEQGRISVIAKGVRSPRSRFASACQPYVCRATKYTAGRHKLAAGRPVIGFSGDIRRHPTLFRLYQRCRCRFDRRAGSGSRYTQDDLNTSTQSPRNTAGRRHQGGMSSGAGMPGICRIFRIAPSAARQCGVTYLDVMNGRLVCPVCLNRQPAAEPQEDSDPVYERSILMPLSAPALAGARYALSALPERMFSFRITDPAACREFHRAAEAYLLNHLERGFDSLNFYKSLVG